MGIGEPRLWKSVELGQYLGAVQMNDGLDLGDVWRGSVNGVIDRLREKMRGGQLVVPAHCDRHSTEGLDHHTQEFSVVRPHRRRRKIPMQFRHNLIHGDVIKIRVRQVRGNGQWIHELCEHRKGL